MPRTLITITVATAMISAAFSQPWPEDRANVWYAKQPWLVGCNFTPSTAINELEMWQADTFDPTTIDRELGWAEGLGMNTMRVFLHDLLWPQDAEGFKHRLDEFLKIADKHHIKIMFVLFDSVWDPNPQLGKQRDPKPGVHNSGCVQAPGRKGLADKNEYSRLEVYVKGVVGAFANDPRVLCWDVWNEPDNMNGSSYRAQEPLNKVALVNALLPQVFAWARAASPTQPLTSGIWLGDWSNDETLNVTEKIQIAQSDVISFHNYGKPEDFKSRVSQLARYRRPLLCTEYMARGNGSTFEGTMPIAKAGKVAVYNWGLVAGKTQTNLPWDSWQKPYVDREPAIWFHEIFYKDGKPYKAEEVEFIRKMTGKTQ